MIKVYSKNNCVQCKMTKKWLTENDVDFIEINIETNNDGLEHLMMLGLKTLPVVEYKDVLFTGFAPNKLKDLKEGL